MDSRKTCRNEDGNKRKYRIERIEKLKDKFLNKIVKKNYNNMLEEVLANKKFSEDVKNTLLSMLYKIENGYDDYKTVKRDTFEKNMYLEKIINTINKECKEIKFVKPEQEEKVDRENKRIECLPIDSKILYSIAKIQKRTVVVKYLDELIEEAFSYVLNIGNNMNIVEPLRDFNGFSWNTLEKDMEDINCNLIYQNIIYLMGNGFVDKWVNNYEPLVDYFELFQGKLEEKYGSKIKDKITKYLIKASLIIKAQKDEEFRQKLDEKMEELAKEKEELSDKEQYVLSITQKRKDIEEKMKKIDKMLIDKNELLKEYKKRNENLPLEKKIFSIRILKNILKEERKPLLEEYNNYYGKMNPVNYIKRKWINEQKLQYIDGDNDLQGNLVNLQKEIINCMLIDIKKAEEKQDIIENIYKYRYYNLLPVDNENSINTFKGLKQDVNKLSKYLINKAILSKVIIQISGESKINYFVTEKLLLSKIIKLEDINLQLHLESQGAIITVFDEKIEDNKIKLKNVTKEELNIKANKKIKLFI